MWTEQRNCSACLKRGKRSFPFSQQGDGDFRQNRSGKRAWRERRLLHRDGELPPERRNGQHDWLDWSGPECSTAKCFPYSAKSASRSRSCFLTGRMKNHEKQEKIRKNKTQRGAEGARTIGARFKRSCRGLWRKGEEHDERRAGETQESEQPENQQPEQEACEVDIKSFAGRA